MPKFKERGAIQFIVLLILLAGLVGGVLLVTRGEPLKLLPKAAPTLPSAPETSFELELEKTGVSPFPDEATPSNIGIGATFRVDLYARSDVEEANLFAAKVKYTADTAELLEINKRDGQSFIKNWVEASVNNDNKGVGVISMVGGVPNPGIKTDSKSGALLFGSIIFKAQKTGILKVEVSDSSAIYSNANNINILTARKGVIEVPISDIQPSPTPTPPSLSCASVNVEGAILVGTHKAQSGMVSIYSVNSGATVKLTAQVSPLGTKVSWKNTGISRNLPNGGTFSYPNSNNTSVVNWIAPDNPMTTEEGVYVRGYISEYPDPTIYCPEIDFAVKPVVQLTPAPCRVTLTDYTVFQTNECTAIASGWGKKAEFTCPDGFRGEVTSAICTTPGDLKERATGICSRRVCPTTSPTPSASPTPSRSFNRVFVTSTAYSGAGLDGLGGADNKCQERADAIKLGGIWKAWLSDTKTSASSRLAHSNKPYKLINGTEVAKNWDDLTDGTLSHAIDMTESSGKPPFTDFAYGYKTAWTNTKSDGSSWFTDDKKVEGNNTCLNWTIGSVRAGGAVGYFDSTDTSWTQANQGGTCGATSALYCIEQTEAGSSTTPKKGSGDGNKDSRIDLADLSTLLTDFNKDNNFREEVDMNADKKINTFDFSLMRNLLIEKKVIKG